MRTAKRYEKLRKLSRTAGTVLAVRERVLMVVDNDGRELAWEARKAEPNSRNCPGGERKSADGC